MYMCIDVHVYMPFVLEGNSPYGPVIAGCGHKREEGHATTAEALPHVVLVLSVRELGG